MLFHFFARQLILIASFFRLLVLCTRSTLFCGHSLKYVWILECARMFCGYAYRIFLGFVCSWFGPRFLLPPCSYKSLADQRGQQLLPGLLLAGRSRLQAKVATYPPDVLRPGSHGCKNFAFCAAATAAAAAQNLAARSHTLFHRGASCPLQQVWKTLHGVHLAQVWFIATAQKEKNLAVLSLIVLFCLSFFL